MRAIKHWLSIKQLPNSKRFEWFQNEICSSNIITLFHTACLVTEINQGFVCCSLLPPVLSHPPSDHSFLLAAIFPRKCYIYRDKSASFDLEGWITWPAVWEQPCTGSKDAVDTCMNSLFSSTCSWHMVDTVGRYCADLAFLLFWNDLPVFLGQQKTKSSTAHVGQNCRDFGWNTATRLYVHHYLEWFVSTAVLMCLYWLNCDKIRNSICSTAVRKWELSICSNTTFPNVSQKNFCQKHKSCVK